jgi:peptide deformylase
MQDLLIESGGIGLSANQVGLDIPLFVLRFKDRVQPVYRPRIINLSGELVKAVEGCLSFPGAFLPIYRYPKITVDFIAFPNNKRLKMSLWGLMARAFQHEVDHLNGKTLFHHYVSSADTVTAEEAPKSVLILD